MKLMSEMWEALATANPKSASDRLFENARPTDHIVGVASDKIKILHGLLADFVESVGDYDICLKGMPEKDPKAIAWRSERAILKHKITTLRAVIRMEIIETHPELAVAVQVDVRRNWFVVYSNEVPEPESTGFLLIVEAPQAKLEPGKS